MTVAAADSPSTVRKKYSVLYIAEAEPHAMYAIYKQTRTVCVLQYMMHGFLFKFWGQFVADGVMHLSVLMHFY